jgi:hypothetical protein
MAHSITEYTSVLLVMACVDGYIWESDQNVPQSTK